MTSIQLELNIENESPKQTRLSQMQKQIDEMSESIGKVRRKLFSEMGELKKLCAELQNENKQLKILLKELKNERLRFKFNSNVAIYIYGTLYNYQYL